jgi:hypothetical protein
MHYIGMLAFHLPIPIEYDWPTVLLSLIAAIIASGIALFVVSRRTMGWFRAIAGSPFMGSGIAAMHRAGRLFRCTSPNASRPQPRQDLITPQRAANRQLDPILTQRFGYCGAGE